MSDSDVIKFEDAKIQKIANVPLSVDKESGGVLSDPKVDITLRVDHGVYLKYANRLQRAWARQVDVLTDLDFAEQLEAREREAVAGSGGGGVREISSPDESHDPTAGNGKVIPIGRRKRTPPQD